MCNRISKCKIHILYLCMERKYKYAGVNSGCAVASTKIDVEADKLEAKMAELDKNRIEANLNLSMPIGMIFNIGGIAKYNNSLGNTNGDKFIINSLSNVSSVWQGQYAKIDGEWLCTPKLFKVLGEFFYNQTMSLTKKNKDYSFIINSIAASTNNTWIRYSDMVNYISSVNGCGVGRARTLMTMFVREGIIVKNKVHNSYKIYSASDTGGQPITVTVTAPVAKTFKYRPDRPLTEEEGFDVRLIKGPLKQRSRVFIPAYCVDERVDNTVFYSIDNWIDKRIECGDEGTPAEWVEALYYAEGDEWLEINWDNWTVRFYAESTLFN